MKSLKLLAAMLVLLVVALSAGTAWCENKDNGNGTITDTATGLVWLKNADCFGKNNWDAATSRVQSLSSGSCDLSDKSKAGQWRLPTKDELVQRASNRQGFTNVQNYFYWSSTLHPYWPSDAWYVHMDGRPANTTPKAFNLCFWPVRAGK